MSTCVLQAMMWEKKTALSTSLWNVSVGEVGQPCTAHLTPNCHSDGWLLFLTIDGNIFSPFPSKPTFSPGASTLVATGHHLFTNSCFTVTQMHDLRSRSCVEKMTPVVAQHFEGLKSNLSNATCCMEHVNLRLNKERHE